MVPNGVDSYPWMGLKSSHGSCAVIEYHQNEIGLVEVGINQGRHCGVKKRRVSANGNNGLCESKFAELSKSICQANSAAHA